MARRKALPGGSVDKQTVLVVDDDNMNVAVLKGLLAKKGLNTISAFSGPKARELAEKHSPDLILLDVMMPEESGFETCVKLKENAATADIPVIFVTCLDDETDKINGLNLGAVDYITKPFSIKEVEARVKAHLKTSVAARDLIHRQADRLGQIRSAQQHMLITPDEIPHARFGIRYVPILEAGGDFYDVLDMSGGRIGYFVADVAGHDLGASFITSSLKAMVHQEAAQGRDPEAILRNINNVLRTITRSKMHLTANFLSLSRDLGRASLFCAGHPPPVILARKKAPRYIEARGDILGVFPEVRIQRVDFDVHPGDRVFLYTDGLMERFIERRPPRRRRRTAFLDLCGKTRDMPLQESVSAVVNAMNLEMGQPEDDIILLGLEVWTCSGASGTRNPSLSPCAAGSASWSGPARRWGAFWSSRAWGAAASSSGCSFARPFATASSMAAGRGGRPHREPETGHRRSGGGHHRGRRRAGMEVAHRGTTTAPPRRRFPGGHVHHGPLLERDRIQRGGQQGRYPQKPGHLPRRSDMIGMTKEDGRYTLVPESKIVASTVEGLEKELKKISQEEGAEVVLDMTPVTDIDSIGVGLLVATHNSLSQTGGKLVLLNTDKEIYSLLSIMRLNDHFIIEKAE